MICQVDYSQNREQIVFLDVLEENLSLLFARPDRERPINYNNHQNIQSSRLQGND